MVGGWSQRADGEIVTEVFEPLTKHHTDLLDAGIERVRHFVGKTRFTIRFPTPLSKRLAAQ